MAGLRFEIRDGIVWVPGSGGHPDLALGSHQTVADAMRAFLDTAQPGSQAASAATAAPADAPAPLPELPVPRANRERIERREERHELTIFGRIISQQGSRDVTILDLSEKGCRFHDKFSALQGGQQVSLKIGPVGPVVAYVKWREKEYVGVEFDNALYPSVLAHIRDHFDVRN